ncbi:MAG: hemerythrin domain-containing protein [Bacteriovoracaceae bacterium]
MNKEELAYLQKVDPVKKQAEVSKEQRGSDLSPMSPPDAFAPPTKIKVEYQYFHPFLKHLVNEHNELKIAMNEFKKIVDKLASTKQVIGQDDKLITRFFDIFITDFVIHNKKEEKILFPVLEKRFLEIGEHSKSSNPITPIDVLVNEHFEALQVAIEAKNTWGLLQQLFDQPSQHILLGAFIRKSNTLLEMMKLHIYREDDIVFSLAQKNLNTEELDKMLL